MGWLFGEPDYKPTARDRWQRDDRDAREERTEARKDRSEAQRIREQIQRDTLAAQEKAAKAAADAEKEIRAAAQDEEKRLLAVDETRYTGATSKLSGPLFVWHWKAEPPPRIAKMIRADHRRGSGPIIALPRGGGIKKSSLVVDRVAENNAHLTVDMDAGAEWYERTRKATDDTLASYPILGMLRNDQRMAELLGNAGVNVTKTFTEDVHGHYGTYTRRVTLVTVPTLREARVERDGLALTFEHQPGVSARDWEKALDKLRTEFDHAGVASRNLAVQAGDGGSVVLRFRDRDPLDDPLPQAVVPYDPQRGRSYIGQAADGSDVYVTWDNNAGVLVAGMVGSGKTQGILPVIAGMAGEAEIHIFDGKGSAAWSPLRGIAATYDISMEREGLVELLTRLKAVAQARTQRLYAETGEDSFWDVPYAKRRELGLYPIIVVIEEAPEFVGVTSTDGKKDAMAVAELSARGMKLWRSAGIIQVVVAQKTTNDQIPAVLRGQCDQRVCFRQATKEDVVSMFGENADPSPMQIPSGKPGRFAARVDTRGLIMGQAVYAPKPVLAAFLRDRATVPDQLGAHVERTDNGAIPMPAPTETKPAQTASTDGDDW